MALIRKRHVAEASTKVGMRRWELWIMRKDIKVGRTESTKLGIKGRRGAGKEGGRRRSTEGEEKRRVEERRRERR